MNAVWCPTLLNVKIISHETHCVFRKSTSKLILSCEFEGCDKIFSSRQYLNVSAESILTSHDTNLYLTSTTFHIFWLLNKKINLIQIRCLLHIFFGKTSALNQTVFSTPQHHIKYQHLHQKTFTCSHPSCRKSFNFKKHLKEHEKLHSSECSVHITDFM